jgi:flagellar protein FlaI
MPEIVPSLEFVHLLNTQGIPVSYAEAIRDPRTHWDRLPREEQSRFLLSRHAEGVPEAVTGMRVLKRRGRADAAHNVVVLFEFEEPARGRWGAFHARNQLLYRAFAPPAAEELEASAHGSGLFENRQGLTPTLHALDHAWGDSPYDVARDGALCPSAPASSGRILEEYWLDEPFSRAVVRENEDHELIYRVEEPRLTALEEALLHTLNERLRDVIIQDADDQRSAAFLIRHLFDALAMYRYHTDRRTAYKLGYYFLRNYLGYARIDAMMRDPALEDVSCNGPLLPVFVAHARHGSLKTNVDFDEMELNSFTMKLAQRGGKLLSVAQPLVDATLPNGSRIQACLGREITSRGSAFTIRKFREDPLTAVDLIRLGTHSAKSMAALWLAVEMRRSAIVMGATASGKTTTLNAIGQFIPPTMKIVSIEDTRELTLQHENWLASITREHATGGTAERVTMFDLLKAALRQRPDYLMVGEIRGIEGLTLFQAMSTGHTCFSTVENAVYRLENPPINVPRVMLSALDFLVIQGQVEVDGHAHRRMLALTEINGIDPTTRNLRVNEVYRWDAARDEILELGRSNVFDLARQRAGWTRTRLDEEFVLRKRLLEQLVARDERHYSQVARAVSRFYSERTDAHSFIPGPVTPEAVSATDAGPA